MPYTVDDTPQTVERIERDLAMVLAAVRAADPALRALVLTGGFARAEGAVLGGQPQNDYDLVAVRGLGRPRTPYPQVAKALEDQLGLHIDLAPVAAWRLRFVAPSIFWYETALRGKVLWGEDVLGRIPVRSAADLDPAEGLRLLVNRAAGLLLATDLARELGAKEQHAVRLQAAKATLAAMDAHLLAGDEFPPSQTERWRRFCALREQGRVPPALEWLGEWLEWAYRFKVDPANAPAKDAKQAWRAAAEAVLDAVPSALGHAGLPTLEAYGRRDGLLDHLVYARRVGQVPGGRLALHPTGRVRVATLRLLEASLDGTIAQEAAKRYLGCVTSRVENPVRALDGLRKATLQ